VSKSPLVLQLPINSRSWCFVVAGREHVLHVASFSQLAAAVNLAYTLFHRSAVNSYKH